MNIHADANEVIAKLSLVIAQLTVDKAVCEANVEAAEKQIDQLLTQIREAENARDN